MPENARCLERAAKEREKIWLLLSHKENLTENCTQLVYGMRKYSNRLSLLLTTNDWIHNSTIGVCMRTIRRQVVRVGAEKL